MFDHFHTIDPLGRTDVYNEKYIDMDRNITENQILKEIIDSSSNTMRKKTSQTGLQRRTLDCFKKYFGLANLGGFNLTHEVYQAKKRFSIPVFISPSIYAAIP